MEGYQARSGEKGGLHFPEGLAQGPEAQLSGWVELSRKEGGGDRLCKEKGHVGDLMRAVVGIGGHRGLER